MNRRVVLVMGDILAMAVVTYIGFATHGETGSGYLPRMAAAFLPLVLAWLVLAPHFDLFSAEIVEAPRSLWRPIVAVLFAGPLAVVIRGLLLNSPIIPVFAVVFSATSAFGMFIWRLIYFLFLRRFAN